MDKLLVLGSFVGLTFIACGSGSGNNTHPTDATRDAPVACTASSSYGAATLTDGSGYAFTAAEITTDGSNGFVDANQGFNGNLNADAAPDSFEIDLYEGFGVWGSGSGIITTGTFTLSGDDLSFQKCGLCIQIFTNIDADGAPVDLYFATGGTVTLTSVGTPTGSNVSTGTLAGSLSNAMFADWDSGSADMAIGSCTSSITSLSFSGALVPVADSFDGAPARIVGHRTR
jgi:hypothetical protein